jgi:cyclic beta-1,2-glucan synthetase
VTTGPARSGLDEPVRAELFGVERLEQHAASLAAAQEVLPASAKGRRLLPRVEENGRVLRDAYRVIARAIREERAITPAAEWLADNFHIVDEQLREIRDDLPPGFYRELPKLADGPLAGYPRVYGLAWAFVAHTDSRLDPDTLQRFVSAYQRVQPLTVGELWAVAITLRVVFVENLRRLAEAIVRGRAARQEADALADEMASAPASFTAPIDLEWFDHAPLPTAFAVQLVQRLRDQDPAVTPALRWLDERLAEQGTTADDIVRLEHQRQAAMNVTVRNVITSMSLMSALNWAAFFESVSLVDDVLGPSGAYAAMDFATRDAYRHAIEELARGSARSELDVARAATRAAGAEAVTSDARHRDLGYHLLGAGRRVFERALGFRPSWGRRFLRAYVAWALPGYLGTIAVVVASLLVLPLLHSWAAGMSPGLLLLLAAAAFVPASDLAVALVNRWVGMVVSPRVLPRLEMPGGVPPELRTMIVVPTFLGDRAALSEQVERLEVHYLANPDGDLRFALLSDWPDATTEHVPGDDEVLAAAREAIGELNQRHGAASHGGARFLLFHRRRVWNASEQAWMGWERKRGKLHELNRLLRGAADTTFTPGETVPPGVRYIVTLDADTQLPRDAVNRLVGTMAHPLNRPRLDDVLHRVVEGYAVLQPRVTPPLPGRMRSLFERLASGSAGIDPYAAAVSDVYQDLFGEGSFTGKGIYDVDAFEAALAGRVPENALLSHDLFEGIFARAGLVTDVELFEHVPSHYGVAAARQHRWARGDWQLLPWIVGRRFRAVPILGRWKMLDNLRRTLSAPAAMATLVAGWTLPGASAVVWTSFVLAMFALPTVPAVLLGVIPRRRGISKRSHVRAVGRDVVAAASHTALVTTMLAHQAWLMSDAIVRSLVRMYVTHRRRLEWVTAAQAKSDLFLDLGGFYRRMGGGVVVAVLAAAAVAAAGGQGVWLLAAPLLLLWVSAPAVARWLSVPAPSVYAPPLSAADARALRLIARRTWRFFATFVGPEDRALPPDNFQEDPHPVVAHRTSPTNIGLSLLATVAARDFGWIGTLDTIDRLEATFESMAALERFRGHFFNWYDTRDGRPLDPRYVSSVDSGNLAGHLIAVAAACREMVNAPALGGAILDGIGDAVLLVRESARALDGEPAHAETRQRLARALDVVGATVGATPSTPAAWTARVVELDAGARMLLAIAHTLVEEDGEAAQAVLVWAEALHACVASHARDLEAGPRADTAARLTRLATQAQAWVAGMDFAFLLDPLRGLLSIGYRVSDGSLDPGCYDLLASEARLTSFLAIAKGDVPVSHWFRLGRALRPVERDAILVSWSGSMFEYLMPALVMRAPTGSLLEQTGRLAVGRHITYGAERHVPWGVSESGYYVRDLEMTYQYSNFGVPDLGLRRGLGDDVVVAPYATGLAAMIDPGRAAKNFRRLEEEGGAGAYGFYEALDYTPARLRAGTRVGIVRTYMAHHQGMLIVALANAVHEGRMRARFHAEPMVQATELLLQERTPRDVAVARPRAEDVVGPGDVRDFVPAVVRRFTTPHTATPRTHLLSNGRYAVMLTAAGAGYSRWRDLAITRWREDGTRDIDGTHLFLRDVASGDTWSAGYQPTGRDPERYEVTFAEDHATIVRHDRGIATTLEVLVSPEDDAEIRRVSLTNLGSRAREIEVTSYAEVVLATAAADAAHPAFSNLFVHTEYVTGLDTLLATRRPRSHEEVPVWLAHVVGVEGETIGALDWDTDRAAFLGRGRGIRRPAALSEGASLSRTAGAVLDPIVSLRRRVKIPPGRTVRVLFSTLIAASEEAALNLADTYRDPATFDRVATLAWTQAQVQLHHLGIAADEAHLFQALASRVLYADRSLRASAAVLERHTGGPPQLWAHGISGDIPIVLVRIDEAEDVAIVRQLLRAHEYWRLKQLAVDLVILNERAPSYVQDLHQLLVTVVRTSRPALPADHAPHGRVFIVRADMMTPGQHDVLHAAARAVLLSRRGTLAEQLARAQRAELVPAPPPPPKIEAKEPRLASPPLAALEFDNGTGGFAENGKEYVTVLGPGRRTPAPWLNVIANPGFGFQVSESGAGYVWSVNSREHQLTEWSNDPVNDPAGETIYVRDDDSGEVWGATALPVRDERATYVARHGHGYSRFERAESGVHLELLRFVPLDAPLEISRLTVTNTSPRARRLSIIAYAEWALGVSRAAGTPFIVTEIEPSTGAMLARNPWSADFGGRTAFADLGGQQTSWTGDRAEFLGRHGGAERPAALERRDPLSGRVGAGLDPCAAMQTSVTVAAGARAEVRFFLGDAPSRDAAIALVVRYRAADLDATLRAVRAHWDDVLDAVQVNTPDRAMDILLNGWLLYQTVACRVWARSAFYQAGGAYGFRDQLQDVMAVVTACPALTREQLLRAAARQFVDGDVQHWWHPPSGRGVRTRISDDLVWLPYVVAHYLDVTEDYGVLEEIVPFLDAAPLAAGQDESYMEPRVSGTRASLLEHCARALDRSLAVGPHGLPLMGTGDWNDGMNRVGAGGTGESVWLGWFLHTVLGRWADLIAGRDAGRARAWCAHRQGLGTALETAGWDGAWYRRAYFDDGTPLGSAANDACRIDSIAQSWSVLSGVAADDRRRLAMAAVTRHLVRHDDGLVALFTPPFGDTALDPGYVKGYPPGVRENGGQYTHAAVWVLMAFAELGDGDTAAGLFAMLNPIGHAATPAAVERYRVEPYVVAADVYAEPPHVGRGGWTWYTGSAGWLYRAGLESILGIRIRGTRLVVDPRIPRAWRGFTVALRFRSARYTIVVENPDGGTGGGLSSVHLDGVALGTVAHIPLSDDARAHEVRVRLRAADGRI